MRAIVLVVILLFALVACLGPKHPREGGTNIGPGSDGAAPQKGGTPALTDR